MRVTSICNATDVHIWEGELGEELRPPFPHVLAHERSGEVAGLGAGVADVAVGDRVGLRAKMDGALHSRPGRIRWSRSWWTF